MGGIKVDCPRCGTAKLERFLGDEVDGWMCVNARKFERGQGCCVLVERKEYQELLEAAQPPPREPEPPSRPPKRVKTDSGADVAKSNSGSMEEEEDPDDEDGEWEGSQFDAMDEQLVDVRVARPMEVRREAVCGLLSLSEVDMVLRGAFVAPRGSDSRQLRGGFSSGITHRASATN
jgi:hypothetical protein